MKEAMSWHLKQLSPVISAFVENYKKGNFVGVFSPPFAPKSVYFSLWCSTQYKHTEKNICTNFCVWVKCVTVLFLSACFFNQPACCFVSSRINLVASLCSHQPLQGLQGSILITAQPAPVSSYVGLQHYLLTCSTITLSLRLSLFFIPSLTSCQTLLFNIR